MKGYSYIIISNVLFFLGTLALVYWIARRGKASDADILRSRLAKGEIGVKEYRRLKKEIEMEDHAKDTP